MSAYSTKQLVGKDSLYVDEVIKCLQTVFYK